MQLVAVIFYLKCYVIWTKRKNNAESETETEKKTVEPTTDVLLLFSIESNY